MAEPDEQPIGARGGNPVLTFRSPDKLTKKVEAFATRQGVPRGRAIRQLIVMGLRAEQRADGPPLEEE